MKVKKSPRRQISSKLRWDLIITATTVAMVTALTDAVYGLRFVKDEVPTTFNGLGYIYLNISNFMWGLQGDSDSISLQYRTRQLTAFLIYAGTDRSHSTAGSSGISMPSDFISVGLQNGSLSLDMSAGGVASNFRVDPITGDDATQPVIFADSRWHRLQILRRREKESKILKVEIIFDDRVLRRLSVRQSGALVSKTLYLGGHRERWLLSATASVTDASEIFFKGCMREARFQSEGAVVDLLLFARDRRHGVRTFGPSSAVAFSGCVDPHVLDAVEFRRPGGHLAVRRTLPQPTTSAADVDGIVGPEFVAAGSSLSSGGIVDSAATVVSVSFCFVTNEPDALLLYLGSNRSDFLAFELRRGRLHVLVDAGAGIIVRRIDARLRLDGLNHVAFVNSPASRAVVLNDNLTVSLNGSGKFQRFDRLDLGAKIYLGGVPSSKRFIIPPELHTVTLNQGFAGFISNLTVNGEGIDLVYELQHRGAGSSTNEISSMTASEAAEAAAVASRAVGECASLPCSNGGICSEGWRRFKCDCSRAGFTGVDCSQRAPTLLFDGTGWVRVSFAAPLRSLTEEVTLRFRTNASSANSLLFASVNRKYASKDTMRLELKDGVLVCTVNYGLTSLALRGDGYILTDGLWHRVRISRREFTLAMTLDDNPNFERSVDGTEKNFKQLETSEIGVGAPSGQYAEEGQQQQQQAARQNFFFGSMSHFTFNGIDYFNAEQRRKLDAESSTSVEVTAREDDSPVDILLPFTVRSPRAFAEMPTLRLVGSFNLRLHFRTGQANGLLLISTGGASRNADFLLLELLNGRLRLALNPGLTSVVTQRELPSIASGQRLDDNRWHQVELRRRSLQRLVFRVDGQPAGSEGFVGDDGGGGFNVNVNKNSLFLGGAPEHLMEARRDVILSGVGFQGCLGSVHLCGRGMLGEDSVSDEARSSSNDAELASVCDVLDSRLNRHEFVDDLTPRCQRPKIECHSQMCYYGGHCLQQRDSVACLCDATSFTGEWCNRVGSATFQFGRHGRPGRLSFEFADETFLPTTKRDDIAFGFQTVRENAPLVRVDAREDTSDYILISIVNRQIRVEYNMKSSTIALDSPVQVSDGRYHRIRFLREETRGSLFIDDYGPQIKHPDASVGTTFNWQKYIQVGRLMTRAVSGSGRHRRSISQTALDDSQHNFQGHLVGLVFNGLPLNRIAAGEDAVRDLARLRIEREGDVQQVADFRPNLEGFPPKDRPEYYRNADLMPTTVPPSQTPVRCTAENRYRSDCINARGINLPDYRGGSDNRSPTNSPSPVREPNAASLPSQSSSSSGESGNVGVGGSGDMTSAKPPVQVAKINLFVIVAVGAAGAILLLVFFCLIYRCRSKNEGSYRVDETQNFANDGIGGPGIQLDPALKPLRSDGGSSSRRHLNGDARGVSGSGKSGSRKRDMKEWYV